jgi:hypothetical protein
VNSGPNPTVTADDATVTSGGDGGKNTPGETTAEEGGGGECGSAKPKQLALPGDVIYRFDGDNTVLSVRKNIPITNGDKKTGYFFIHTPIPMPPDKRNEKDESSNHKKLDRSWSKGLWCFIEDAQSWCPPEGGYTMCKVPPGFPSIPTGLITPRVGEQGSWPVSIFGPGPTNPCGGVLIFALPEQIAQHEEVQVSVQIATPTAWAFPQQIVLQLDYVVCAPGGSATAGAVTGTSTTVLTFPTLPAANTIFRCTFTIPRADLQQQGGKMMAAIYRRGDNPADTCPQGLGVLGAVIHVGERLAAAA